MSHDLRILAGNVFLRKIHKKEGGKIDLCFYFFVCVLTYNL